MTDVLAKLESLEKKIQVICEAEDVDLPDEALANSRIDFDEKLSDDDLESFVDGLLIALGEIQMRGKFEINSPAEARDAVMAAVRLLYRRKSLVAKMSRKFARFGAKQFLQKQKREIGKSLA